MFWRTLHILTFLEKWQYSNPMGLNEPTERDEFNPPSPVQGFHTLGKLMIELPSMDHVSLSASRHRQFVSFVCSFVEESLRWFVVKRHYNQALDSLRRICEINNSSLPPDVDLTSIKNVSHLKIRHKYDCKREQERNTTNSFWMMFQLSNCRMWRLRSATILGAHNIWSTIPVTTL